MPNQQIKDFLDKQHVNYTTIDHSPAFTAQEVAAAAHVSGKSLAKIVIVRIAGKLAMVVLPAHDHVNFAALKRTTGETEIDLAPESSFKTQFPECETGAMPPFGTLYDMPVYLASQLSQQDQITFNAGTHSELMQMAYSDFEKVEHPHIIHI